MANTGKPVEYLLDASLVSLGEYELSRLNTAANLRKDMGQALEKFARIVEALVEAESEARVARYVREIRNRGLR